MAGPRSISVKSPVDCLQSRCSRSLTTARGIPRKSVSGCPRGEIGSESCLTDRQRINRVRMKCRSPHHQNRNPSRHPRNSSRGRSKRSKRRSQNLHSPLRNNWLAARSRPKVSKSVEPSVAQRIGKKYSVGVSLPIGYWLTTNPRMRIIVSG
jgi:hypothetical protein